MRLQGWEKRLDTLIEDARSRQYRIGEHDCFRLACAAVKTLTGRDRWPEFRGRYATQREAMRLLAKHGTTFEAAGDWFFGSDRIQPSFARRGDIMVIEDEQHKHLGVCVGAVTAFLAPGGLVFVPTLSCTTGWRID